MFDNESLTRLGRDLQIDLSLNPRGGIGHDPFAGGPTNGEPYVETLYATNLPPEYMNSVAAPDAGIVDLLQQNQGFLAGVA